MVGPVLLCGLGRVGWRVLDCLRTAGVPVVVIDTKADPADPRLTGIHVVRGDCREPTVLTEAGVTGAGGVIIVTSDDLQNISAALMVRRLNPGVRIVVRMFNQNLITRLGRAVPNMTALSVSALAAPLLALTALTGGVLAAFPAGPGRMQVADVTIPDGSKLVGRPVGEFDDQRRYQLIAHRRSGAFDRLLLDIDPATPLEAGDRVVVGGSPNDVRRLLEPGWDDRAGVLWAGRLRRFGRVAYRTVAEVETLVKISVAILAVVVVGSTLTYHCGLDQSWADSVYKTISIVFTGSDMGGTEYEGWGKVFVSALKMSGTFMIAAATAIFTNYLLRARLRGVFEVRRLPDHGHVVVVGLGNVGYRVVEELTRLEERPVVIEQKSDLPFVATCRRKGVPVIVGDATVRETLRQARAHQARAIIACTDADLVNLEIALLAAELNEKQRVVVRLSDPVLAETARIAAGVRMAISIPELAGPAFVASLLGDRVLAMFPVAGQMLAVVEVTVQPEDAVLIGHSLRALAIDYRLVPLAMTAADGKPRDLEAGYRLAAGDRLIGVATVPDLERVTQRSPAAGDCSVEVLAYPGWARDTVLQRVRVLRSLTSAEAEAMVGKLPFVIAEGQTKGQAVELVGLLQREKVDARVVSVGSEEP